MNFKKIYIKNFKNYEKETLDLESSSFWILRGKNSSGKSTLACDALTYALFGHIKAQDDPQDTRVSIDDIVKRGQTKTIVRIEFSNKGDNFYIERVRTIKKGGAREALLIKKNGQIVHNKDANKTKGDQWIKDNLWTYKDFTNTTLIMQDEMTKALDLARNERRDYLERLFGIKDFHEMSVISREKGKEHEKTLNKQEAIINTKKEMLVDPSELEAKKIEFENQLLKKEKIRDQLKEKRKLITDNLEIAKSNHIEYLGLNKTLVDYQKQHESIKESAKSKQHQLENIDTKISSKEEIQTKLNQISQIEKEIESLKSIKERIINKQELKSNLKQQINREKIGLEKDIKSKEIELDKFKEELLKAKSTQNELVELSKKKPEIEKDIASEAQILKEFEVMKITKEKLQEFQTKVDQKIQERNIKIEAKSKEYESKQKEVGNIEKLQSDFQNKEKAKSDIISYEKQLKQTTDNISELQSDIQQLISTIDNNKKNILDYEEDLKTIEIEIQSISDIHEQATCPTCKQNLQEEHINALVSEFNNKRSNIKQLKLQLEYETTTLEKELQQKEGIIEDKKTTADESSKTIEKLRIASDGLDASKEKLDLAQNYKEEIDKFEAAGGIESLFPDLKKEIKDLHDKISKINFDPQLLSKLEEDKNQIEVQKNELKHINHDLDQLPKVEASIKQIEIDISETKSEIEKLNLKISKNDFSLEERKQLESLETEISSLVKELNIEDKLILRLAELQPEEMRMQLEEIETAEKEKIQIETELKALIKNDTDIEKKIKDTLQLLEQDKFVSSETKVAELQIQHDEIEKEYVGAIKIAQQSDTNLQDHQKHIREQNDLRAEIDKLETEIKSIQTEFDTYKLLELIFKQIGGRILSRLRHQINVATIEILYLLGNPQLEGITLNKDFSLTIQTPNGNEKPGFFSGGQKVRIGFAFRLALSKVLAEFRGNELDTLIIDEGGFGALDEDGQEGVIDVFKSLQDRYKRVLVISHIPQITNNLPGLQIMIENGKIVEQLI